MKYHTLMNMYYEDYGNENAPQKTLELPYCVFCKNYEDGIDFCNKLKDLGLTEVHGLAVGYRVVLVNLKAKRYGGTYMACNHANKGEFSRTKFESKILNNFIESQSLGI